ncbi:MAG: hypothetical protein QOH91_231 [Mycobacterium sp.]|nr:hypothetical protein [Mycobacterium sp.]
MISGLVGTNATSEQLVDWVLSHRPTEGGPPV